MWSCGDKNAVDDAIEIYKIRKVLDTIAVQNAMTIMTKEFNDMIYSFCRRPRLDFLFNKIRQNQAKFRDNSFILWKEERYEKNTGSYMRI